jgi:hypothetical protein
MENTATFALAAVLYFTKSNKYSMECLALNETKA